MWMGSDWPLPFSLPYPGTPGLLLGHEHQTQPHFHVLGLSGGAAFAGESVPIAETQDPFVHQRSFFIFYRHFKYWSHLHQAHAHPGRGSDMHSGFAADSRKAGTVALSSVLPRSLLCPPVLAFPVFHPWSLARSPAFLPKRWARSAPQVLVF